MLSQASAGQLTWLKTLNADRKKSNEHIDKRELSCCHKMELNHNFLDDSFCTSSVSQYSIAEIT